MSRTSLELRQEIAAIKQELARNGSTPSTDLVMRLVSLVDQSLQNEERRVAALENAFDDLDRRQFAFDNSRFFRLLRWPGRFLTDWKGRFGQKLLRSPFHSLYRRIGNGSTSRAEYSAWVERESAGLPSPATFLDREHQFGRHPLISLVMPVYKPARQWLDEAIDSVLAQTYSCWELCICDDGSPEPWLASYLDARAAADSRIHSVRSPSNEGISAASNHAAVLARGEYVGFLDQDDVLPPYALHYVAEALQSGAADLIYSDEDRLDENGRRVEPVFKPAWSPDLLLGCMYMGHFLVVRRAAAEAAGWFRGECDGAQDHDLALRITAGSARVRHIPRVLYHWRKHPGSTSTRPEAKPFAQTAGLKAVSDAVERRGSSAMCENGPLPHTYRVRWQTGKPEVSLVVCSRNAALLRRSVDAVRRSTTYPNFSFTFVEHDMETRFEGVRVSHTGPFDYARMNNAGAAVSPGQILVFLNDDVEPLVPDWLDYLVMHVQRPEIGMAGARLVYPSGAIQHAGLTIGMMKNGVGHLCRDTFGVRYWPWLLLPRNVSAVTAACLAIRKNLFRDLGGFDPGFPVNYNDADLCLRARQRGYQVIYEPAALLRHYECRTRIPGVRYRETARWQDRWSDWLERGDPFYNPNLARNREDASLAMESAGPADNSR